MLDFSFGELAVVALVALLIVGPKDLPRVMHAVGRWFGQFKGFADEFRDGFKSAMREHDIGAIEKELTQVHEEIEFIRDQDGNLQRVYDISDFLDDSGRAKIKTAPIEAEQKS